MTANKSAAARSKEILAASLDLAESKGFNRVTRTDVAEATGLGAGTVNLHFGNMEKLRRAIMRAAIRQKRLRVIAQGLALQDPIAMGISDDLRQLAADSIKG